MFIRQQPMQPQMDDTSFKPDVAQIGIRDKGQTEVDASCTLNEYAFFSLNPSRLYAPQP